MKPTIGRIVHFYDHTRPRNASGSAGPFAAIITSVIDAEHGEVTLTVFPDGYPPVGVGPVYQTVPEIGQSPTIGQFWCWPPRDEPRTVVNYDSSAELPRNHHAALGMAALPDPIAPADAGDTSTAGN